MLETMLGKAFPEKEGEPAHSDDTDFKLDIEARVRRCGREVRLVLPVGSADQVPRTDSSLLKAIARAHDWYERAINGEISGRRSIGKLTGLPERYAGRILQCAFLAPDIVELILHGRQPVSLLCEKFRKHLPADWEEQRRCFGAGGSTPKVR